MYYLVIDVGGTFIKFSVMDGDTNFYERGSVPTPRTSIEDFKETIGSIYDRFSTRIQGIAVSMPGRIDSKNGYAYTGGSISYNYDKDIVNILQSRCPLPIHIENDGKCAAMAELWKGSLSDCTNGLAVVFGTGVGGGIIQNKKLYKGSHFFAGELSYIKTNLNDTPCSMDNMWGIISGAKGLSSLVAAHKNFSKEEKENLDGKKIFTMAAEKDADVLHALNEFTRIIAVQFFNLQCILDIERIAIGGGISAQDLLISLIRDNLNKLYVGPFEKLPRAKIVRCRFQNDANLLGALYSFLTEQTNT
jgi:predicted NBD/HSP70 family sugar kinase